MIKIIDDKFIKVQLTKDSEMLTNIEFIPLIQKIKLFSGQGGGSNAQDYAKTSINNMNINFVCCAFFKPRNQQCY